jgi:hypothetical protein
MLDAVQELTNLTDELDIVRQVSAKLMKKPSSGAENLVTALQELSKTFDAIDLELKRYLALDFSEPNRPAARKDLVALEGGEIYKRVGDARARSGKIGSIYREELQPWFVSEKELTDQERADLGALLTNLGNSDYSEIVPAVQEVSEWLTKKAEATLSHVDAGHYDKAVEDVRAARREVLSLRQAIWKTSAELRDLEIQFTPGKAPPGGYPF